MIPPWLRVDAVTGGDASYTELRAVLRIALILAAPAVTMVRAAWGAL